MGNQSQPHSNSNPTTTATQQRQLLQNDRNTTVTENEQPSDGGYLLPLNANVPGHNVTPAHEYIDVIGEGSNLLTPANQQNQNTERNYELPLHEYRNVTGDDHAYDRVSRSNEGTF
jgi:hypothetical protein